MIGIGICIGIGIGISIGIGITSITIIYHLFRKFNNIYILHIIIKNISIFYQYN